jgi:hypothetical protein
LPQEDWSSTVAEATEVYRAGLLTMITR